MRTHLEFKADRFKGGAGNSYNPDIMGAELAAFLSSEFRALGYDGTVIEEDWGWTIALRDLPFKTWLGCANYEDSDGWLVFIEPSKPFAGGWFRKKPTAPVIEPIADQLETVVAKNGGATNLRWWSDSEK